MDCWVVSLLLYKTVQGVARPATGIRLTRLQQNGLQHQGVMIQTSYLCMKITIDAS